MMANGWLLVVTICALFTAVNGNFTINSPQVPDDILCREECQFFPDNQTIAIINITSPGNGVKGVAYYATPVRMKDPATRRVASFETSFIFREEPMNYFEHALPADQPNFKRGDGFTFLMSNSSTWTADAQGRFGIFKLNDNPKVVAIEYDSYRNLDFEDSGLFDREHVGVDIATPVSLNNTLYPNCFAYVDTLGITFWHRDVLHSWIDYDGTTSMLQVRLANTSSRPLEPLINCYYDLVDAVDEKMWIGFSGSFGTAWSIYYIYDWKFTSHGIPSEFASAGKSNLPLILGVSGGVLLAILILGAAICVFFRRKRAKEGPWDTEEGLQHMANMPDFISYKHLSAATKQFSDQSKLGEGGFGSVYRGKLPRTGQLVAVKKVAADSRQGAREFLAEVQIIRQLRHRNIVELVGFCNDRGRFLLVYELMPRGSLDQALFKFSEDVLSWSLRWKIVSGTAAAVHYLHEGGRQQVIHRDVKSSNIMLDDEYNPKLGDFGLARLVDHEKHAATTMVAGTYGYIAPEAARTGKFTDKTDVFAFGAVCLELACGRKAYDNSVADVDDLILVDVVWRAWNQNNLLSVADPLLQYKFDEGQMLVVLKLGLLCSNPDAASRPSMRQVEQVLAGDADVPYVPVEKPTIHMRLEQPELSIDDLMSSRTSSQNFKLRTATSTSTAFDADLYPR